MSNNGQSADSMATQIDALELDISEALQDEINEFVGRQKTIVLMEDSGFVWFYVSYGEADDNSWALIAKGMFEDLNYTVQNPVYSFSEGWKMKVIAP